MLCEVLRLCFSKNHTTIEIPQQEIEVRDTEFFEWLSFDELVPSRLSLLERKDRVTNQLPVLALPVYLSP